LWWPDGERLIGTRGRDGGETIAEQQPRHETRPLDYQQTTHERKYEVRKDAQDTSRLIAVKGCDCGPGAADLLLRLGEP